MHAQEPTNRGTEFWTGYGHHYFMDKIPDPLDPNLRNTQSLFLYFSAGDEAAEVTVSINNTTWTKTYSVAAHTVIVSDEMPKYNDATMIDARLFRDELSGGSEGLYTDRGIHITSTKPIVAYAHVIATGASGASMLMPVNTWGYSYYSLNTNQSGGTSSWAYVIASHDNTKVEITPSIKTYAGKAAGTPFYVTLQKGEVYQMLSEKGVSDGSGGGGYEMSGTKFLSVDNGAGQCYPIGVFSGCSSTQGKTTCNYGYQEPDMQQVFPTHAWGKRYLTAPTSRDDKVNFLTLNSYKVLVKDVNTVVKRNGVVLTGLKNNYYYFESTTADVVEADKPIMVAQYLLGGRAGCPGASLNSDPDMIYLSPIDQGINNIGFFRNNRNAIVVNYLTLIVTNKGTGLSSLRIDGQPVSSFSAAEYYSYPHPQMPDFTVVVKRWGGLWPYPADPPGQCVVTSDSAFTAITYGLGSGESYAYNAGTHIYNLDARSSIHNNLSATNEPNAFTCVDAPVSIFALVAYKPTSITWKLSALAGSLSPAVDVTDSAPVSTETVELNGALYYKYTLPGTYQFNSADTFYLPAEFTSPEIEKCDHKEELLLRIIVKPKPKNDYTFSRNTNCTLDTVHFSGTDKAPEGYTFYQWNWLFPDAATATGKDTVHLLAAGADQPVKLRSVTTEGCVADTVKKIVVYAPPQAAFVANEPVICAKGTYTFTGTATYEGTGSLQWYWIMGNGNTQTSATNITQPETYNTGGNYTVKLVVKAGSLCASDTISKVVKVYSAPTVSISYPEGCLPKDGMVTFANNSTVADGQTITSHQWNFGDANATAANPNTATVASPSHVYVQYGNYNVTYKATSTNGCVTDTVIKAVFNPAPQFTYDVLTAVCEKAAAVSVAKALVTNGVPGTGIYKGPGTSTTGVFTPSQAGAGVHTIWYVYTTDLGCVDSAKQTIEVYAAPVADFTFVNNVCAGGPTKFTPTATVATGNTITQWSWNFGDKNTSNKTTGTAFDYTYATYGTYRVILTATSNHNCASVPDTQSVVVQPLPVADFTVPDTICMPGGAAVFTNKSSVPGNGSLAYNWNFGDGTSTSATVSPSHIYATSGSYTVTLTATTAAGCVNTAAKVADKFSDKPVAIFTVVPAEICQDGQVKFTDASTAAGSTVSKWGWTFSDGTTASIASPVKVYKQAGTATATLVVKNAKGCASLPLTKSVVVHAKPVIDAGVSFMVKEGTQVQFDAYANSSAYQLQWYPATGLSNANILKPYLTVTQDVTYTLTATGEFNCTTTDTLTVKILRDIAPPNVFTPNGDGIHDVWEIPYLSSYTNGVIDVFNRYGQSVFHSIGYAKPWDGRMNGQDVPTGTYYYIIKLGTGLPTLSGSVTIIR
ncbi:hypothetical protein FLA_4679 [Filimonas lacunae]|nr:hypothetical protein FLA_4679 [Filimonas lacunae]